MIETAQPGTYLRLALAGGLFAQLGCDLHEPVGTAPDSSTEPDSGSEPDAGSDASTDSGTGPGCADGQAQYASQEACMADGATCHAVGPVWCGGPLVECCQAEPSCDPHQASFVDRASCDALWSGCEERSACCSSVVCGPPGSALAPEITVAYDVVSLRFGTVDGLYYLSCAHAFSLLKPGTGDQWVRLRNDPLRDWDEYYLDGVYHPESVGNEGCDQLECFPLGDQTLSLDEYLLAETPEDPHPGVPDYVTVTYRGPLRVQVGLYADPSCPGAAPYTRTYDVATP